MTNRELLYVKTIADEQSISKAAKKLYMAQPSLSQSIQRLEENLGSKLFNRTPTGLTLTLAGERYYQAASQILKIYEDLELELSDMNDLKTGRINLGITNHLGTVLLPKILPEFCMKYPKIEMDIVEVSSTELDSKLLSGELDFAIMHIEQAGRQPQFEYEILSESPFVIAVSPDSTLIKQAVSLTGYPFPVIDVTYLKKEKFLMLHTNQGIRQVTDSILKSMGMNQPDIKMTLRNFETVQLLAARGMGITMVPLDYIALTGAEVLPSYLCIDRKYNATWDMCIATSKGHYLSKADRTFIQMIQMQFGKA